MSDELSGSASSADGSSGSDDIRGAAAQAFAAQMGDTPPAPPADTPSEPPPSPDGATSAGDTEVEPTTFLRGPIPFDRHQAVITNTRNKVRAEVEGEWKPKYDRLSWAETVDAQRAKDGISILTALEAMQDDPHAAVAFVARRLGITADALAQPNGKPSEPADPMPEPDIPLDDGTAVYSASRLQQLLQWHGRQMTQQVDQSFGLSDLKHRALLSDLRMQAQRQTHDVLTECRTNEADWPMFRSLENDIKQLMIQHPDLSLEGAYRRAFNGPNGWRKQQAATQKAAEEDRASQLTRKAAASDTLRTGAPRPVTPRGPDELTTREIAQQVFSSMH